MNLAEFITVVIPTSPIPLHPSTDLIDRAVQTIRQHIPGVSVLIQCDGIRLENENRKTQYEEYKLRLSMKAKAWGGTQMIFFGEYRHQAEMMRDSFPWTQTPLLFYLEHDWEILDAPIDWAGMAEAIISGELNLIRLYRWDEIVECHQHLMHGEGTYKGVPVVRTTQWSGHPHLASVPFYEKLIAQFRPGCRTLIEEFIYGPVVTAPWEDYKCAIYKPEGLMKRIWHTDGRGEDPKFEAQF